MGRRTGLTQEKPTRGRSLVKREFLPLSSYDSKVIKALIIFQVSCAIQTTERCSIYISTGSFTRSDFTPKNQFRDMRKKSTSKEMKVLRGNLETHGA